MTLSKFCNKEQVADLQFMLLEDYWTLSTNKMTDSSTISKICNPANVLRDDGVGYGDYLEQITYLLFLK